MVELGFEVGSACMFFHRERAWVCSVHGGDLTTEGRKRHLDWFKQELSEFYELKAAHRFGLVAPDEKEAWVLNQIVRWITQGLEYLAARQCETLLRDLKLDGEGVKAVGTLAVRAIKDQLDADVELPRAQASPYRAVAARSNYFAADRPGIQFAAKECCQWISKPTDFSIWLEAAPQVRARPAATGLLLSLAECVRNSYVFRHRPGRAAHGPERAPQELV